MSKRPTVNQVADGIVRQAVTAIASAKALLEAGEAAACPKCGRLSTTPSSANDKAWYCHECKMEFEPEDDGTIGYGPPSRRLEREERRRKPHG